MPFKAYSEILNNLKLFSGIAVDERDKLLSQGHLRHLNPDDMLFRHGDPIDHFYIVCSGAVRLTRETPDGKQITTDISPSGKTIGKSDIFQTRYHQHRVSAIAVDKCTVLEFPASWLRDIAKHPTFALNILSAISEYAHMAELESEQRITMTAAQRLGCFLQRTYVVHGLNPKGFELPYSKALIASRLGMKPETFSRTLATLNEHGMTVTDTHVSFHNIHEIECFICNHCSMNGECHTQAAIAANEHASRKN